MVEWRPRSEKHEVIIPVEHKICKTNKIKGKPGPNMGLPGDIYGIDLFEDVWSHLESKSIYQ